jgi:hypothetical protein
MRKPMEILLRAKDVLRGKYSDPCEDNSGDVGSAVESILEYLITKEATEEYQFICHQIDKAQKAGDTAKAAQLMVDRDRVMEVLK